ncbi:MAG: helix-turn-helix transcriptional regulator [Bacteroidetes bacterium]|nr:helix-turn-helix transcriptional regulator [Bacteroidota bacterium]
MSSKEQLLKNFGKRLVMLRKEQNLSQSDLARLTGKDRQNIYRIEKGDLNPTLFQLTELATALKISVSELVNLG